MAATMVRLVVQKGFSFAAATCAPCHTQRFSIHFSSLLLRKEQPKRAIASPYMVYINTVLNDLRNQNPDKKITEVVSMAAAKYRSMDDAEKQIYKETATAQVQQYKKDYSEWWESLTEEERQEITDEKKRKSLIRENRKMKQLCREHEKPRTPPNYYGLYMAEVAKDFHSFKEALQEGRFKWAALTDSERQDYKDKAKVLHDEHEAALLAWEKDMIGKNLQQLVRKKTLVKLGLAKRKPVKESPKKQQK